jgi:hypothetical protein
VQLGAALAENVKLERIKLRGVGADPVGLSGLIENVEGKNFSLRDMDLIGNPALAKTDWDSKTKGISFKIYL